MISVIIPFYNEEKNLPILIKDLLKILNKIKNKWEIILVNDGSTDNSISNLKSQISNLKIQDKNYKILQHKRRLGKGRALKTGVENSSGEILVFMDGDLQDDPQDLPKFLEKINQGYDFVNGMRVKRQDKFLVKTYSKLAGLFLKKILHSPFEDINCGFKAFKREVLQDFVFYGNNFRFFPLWVYYQGYKVIEVEVKNNPRRFGESKFGSRKVFIGLIDLLTAYFLFKFSEKPLHFFGAVGGFLFFLGSLILFYLFIERIFFHHFLYRRPILFLGILLVIIGIQIVMTGIIGELIVYFNNQKSRFKANQP